MAWETHHGTQINTFLVVDTELSMPEASAM